MDTLQLHRARKKSQRQYDYSKYEDAIKTIDKILESYPDEGIEFFLKAQCLEKLGKSDEAQEYYEKMVSQPVNRQDISIFVEVARAQAYKKLKKYEESLNEIEHALTRNKYLPEALQLQPDILYALGKYERCIYECNQLINKKYSRSDYYAKLRDAAQSKLDNS